MVLGTSARGEPKKQTPVGFKGKPMLSMAIPAFGAIPLEETLMRFFTKRTKGIFICGVSSRSLCGFFVGICRNL